MIMDNCTDFLITVHAMPPLPLDTAEDIEDVLDLPTPSPVSSLRQGNFSRLSDSQYYAASAKLCVNLVILLVTVLDLLLQLSTLRCSWQTFQLISASMKISK